MKQNKTICLEYEYINLLAKEPNASQLIEDLLRKHYKDNRTEEEIINDVKNLIKEKEEKQANKDKYTNPKHLAKRLKEMKTAKRKNGI